MTGQKTSLAFGGGTAICGRDLVGLALVNIAIGLRTDGKVHWLKVEGETSDTPGLVVTPAWVNPNMRAFSYMGSEFDETECQIIHHSSRYLVATFHLQRQAMAAARELGNLEIRWHLAAVHVRRHVEAMGLQPKIREILERYQYLEREEWDKRHQSNGAIPL